MKIIPTVFSKNKKGFEEKFNRLRNVSKYLQIDFMDGEFVKAKGVLLKDIPNLKKYDNSIEAHLMVNCPEKWILPLAKKGFKKIIFHYESQNNDEEILNTTLEIKKNKLEPVLAVNPKTKYSEIKNILNIFKIVQLMGVEPGKEQQTFDSSVYNKIKIIKKNHPKIKVQIDGGANIQTVAKLKSAGADIICSGSFVAKSKNPKEAIRLLKNG